jgi:DNA mismatch repair protein MLH3
LAALSLLTITSHHHLHHSHNTITFGRSQVIARHVPAHEQYRVSSLNHGSRVTVQDIFGNMPVRVKQRAVGVSGNVGFGREWEELRKGIAALLLAWPKPVAITVNDVSTRRVLRIRKDPNMSDAKKMEDDSALRSHVCHILLQASYISSPEKSSWATASARTSKLNIMGVISLDPAPTRNIQFISLGVHPLENLDRHNAIYEEINRLFASSTFGNQDDLPDLDDAERKRRLEDRRYKSDGFTNKELKGSGKGVDRWPMFYIRIEHYAQPTGLLETEDLMDHQKSLNSIIKLIQTLIMEFLRTHHFSPKPTRSVKRSLSNNIANVTTSKDKSQDLNGLGSFDTTNFERGPVPPLQMTVQFGSSIGIKEKESPHTYPKHPMSASPSTRSQSPFNTWSRVKSGRPPAKSPFAKSHPGHDMENHLPKHGAPGPPPNSTISEGSLGSAIAVSKSGTVVHRPFMDVHRPNFTFRQLVPISTSNSQSPMDSENYDLIEWLDPTTRETALINSRTGLAERAKNPALVTSLDGNTVIARSRYSQKSLSDRGHQTQEKSAWVNGIIRKWNNPVFQPAEVAIPQVAAIWTNSEAQNVLHGYSHRCSQVDIDRAFKAFSAGSAGQLSKEDLRNAEVISQVDKKFILVKMPLPESDDGYMLVIVDQHAADERCRIEELIAEFCRDPPTAALSGTASFRAGVPTVSLDKIMMFDVSQQDKTLLDSFQQHFADWGILYRLKPGSIDSHSRRQPQLIIDSLPPGIIERCKLDPKLVIDLIRSEAWSKEGRNLTKRDSKTSNESTETPHGKGEEKSQHPWLKKLHDCPQGILDMLNSRSCRSEFFFHCFD